MVPHTSVSTTSSVMARAGMAGVAAPGRGSEEAGWGSEEAGWGVEEAGWGVEEAGPDGCSAEGRDRCVDIRQVSRQSAAFSPSPLP